MPIYNYDELDTTADMAESTQQEVKHLSNEVRDFNFDIDWRIKECYEDEFTALRLNNLGASERKASSFEDWLRDSMSQINFTDTGLGTSTKDKVKYDSGESGGTTPYTPISTTPVSNDPLTIDPVIFDSLPKEEQDAIKEKLKDAGYTDAEIEDILDGKVTLDKDTTEAIEKELKSSFKLHPKTVEVLEKVSGLDIVDADGNVDLTKLEIAELIAKKNLGMDIDMTPGSKFSRHLDTLSSELKTINEKDPALRQEIIDKYGEDIFDKDGNVDKEKLALIRVIDGQDLNDDYDITKTIEKYKESTSPATDPVIPTDPITTDPPAPITTDPPAPITTDPEKGEDPGPSTTPEPKHMVTPVETPTNDTGSSGPFGIDGHKTDGVATSVASSLGEAGKGILSSLNKKTAGVAGAPSYSIGNGGNKAAAGIIAAASIAAGGAATGGGVLIHKKTSKLKFTPADWEGLGEDYQTVIEQDMKAAGYDDNEIEIFKVSNYKIHASVLKEHEKRILSALETNPNFEDDFVKVYNYTFIDENRKVVDYLLFITMVIDGKNVIDDFNMYNIINQSTENADEADFVYTGINPEEYVVGNNDEDEVDDEDLQILNDPTTTDYDVEAEADTEGSDELEEVNEAIDKEWLKGIGLVD